MNSKIDRFPIYDGWVAKLAVVLLLVGCGSKPEGPLRASVTGSVTLDGEPLKAGVVRFQPVEETSGPQTSINIVDGKFDVDEQSGPVVGQHRVEIESSDDGGYAMDDEEAFKKLQEQGIRKIEVVKVPPQYNTRSTLQETVAEEGPNTFKFDLTTKKQR